MNPYSYLQNNPLSGIDPTGYVACDESGQNCDIGSIKTDDIESVQTLEDGSTVVNTTDGSSFRVDKVSVQSNGFKLSASFKGNNTFDMSIEKIGDESSKVDFELSYQGNEAAENANIMMGMLTGPGETVNQAFYGETEMERLEGKVGLMAMAFTGGMSSITPSRNRRVGRGLSKKLPSKGARYKLSMQFFRNSSARVKDIELKPQSIWGKSANEIADIFKSEGYKVTIQQSTRGSGNAILVRVQGHQTIQQIQVHPGGGRHGGAYYKISTTNKGTQHIVDKETFIPGNLKSNIIYKE